MSRSIAKQRSYLYPFGVGNISAFCSIYRSLISVLKSEKSKLENGYPHPGSSGHLPGFEPDLNIRIFISENNAILINIIRI